MTEPGPNRLFTDWNIPNFWCFLTLAVLGGLAIRIFSTLLRALDLKYADLTDSSSKRFDRSRTLERGKLRGQDLLDLWWHCFLSKAVNGNRQTVDLWQPFIIGTMELIAFPVLMRTDAWTIIAAWIALKVPWTHWQENRHALHRYMIGTALVFGWAFFLARMFVEP